MSGQFTVDEGMLEVEFAGREIASMDRTVFEPRRLGVLNALCGGREAGYPLLQRITGLSMGGLSTHLRRLERAALIEVRKTFVGRRPRTLVVIIPEGERALAEFWGAMNRLSERRPRGRCPAKIGDRGNRSPAEEIETRAEDGK